ncbi:hypothetical protein [Methylotenera sp. N17]|uniref:hypothetical protein n=1 Tax=Methylotenera sp. N17 TaxID=1502761 RepID=UPI00068E182E|nr:hypothetical protein [Methylotenera sp. N17]
MSNLFVSYDAKYLPAIDFPFPPVYKAIESLGMAIKLHPALWYISSSYTASEAYVFLGDYLDEHEKLVVIDASSNDFVSKGYFESYCVADLWQQPLIQSPL